EQTVKRKRAARAVHGCAPGCQPAEFHSGHDVVRAVAPTDLLRELAGAVVLVPVGSAVTESIEAGDTEVGNAGVIVYGVPGEARDPQVCAGGFLIADGEGIDGSGIYEIPAQTEIIHQAGRERVGVTESVVGDRGGRGRSVDGNRTPAKHAPILPV